MCQMEEKTESPIHTPPPSPIHTSPLPTKEQSRHTDKKHLEGDSTGLQLPDFSGTAGCLILHKAATVILNLLYLS